MLGTLHGTRTPAISAELLEGLDDWRALHRVMHVATENDLWSMLAHEKAHKSRKHYLIRLYGRANKLRYEREFNELMAAA